jgi:hypothetical protein
VGVPFFQDKRESREKKRGAENWKKNVRKIENYGKELPELLGIQTVFTARISFPVPLYQLIWFHTLEIFL